MRKGVDSIMGMSPLKVEPEKLIVKAGEFSRHASAMQKTTSEMFRIMDQLNGAIWSGSTAKVYKSLFRNLSDDVSTMVKMIKEFSSDLKAIAEEYKRTEKRNEEDSKRLKTSIDWEFSAGVAAALEGGGEIIFDQDLYNNNKFYKMIADLISQIGMSDGTWNDELIAIKDVYDRQKERYEALAKESGIPPEAIASIHYRENREDYMNETFSIYLHNGDLLGTKSNQVPYPDSFAKDEFDKATIDALKGWDGQSHYKENRAKQLNLTSDSKDLTAMATYTVFYNGWNHGGLSSYTFNGTDIFSGGLYTSDHNYNTNAKDQNCGTYLIIEYLLTN